jgi:hypothetical protein
MSDPCRIPRDDPAHPNYRPTPGMSEDDVADCIIALRAGIDRYEAMLALSSRFEKAGGWYRDQLESMLEQMRPDIAGNRP